MDPSALPAGGVVDREGTPLTTRRVVTFVKGCHEGRVVGRAG